MPDKPSDLIQGTLEMLILKTLALEPMHGYGIALRIEQTSNGVFRVNPGSLFPALSRLERAARIKAEWRTPENRRRRHSSPPTSPHPNQRTLPQPQRNPKHGRTTAPLPASPRPRTNPP